MKDLFARIWMDLNDRVGGPMTFRLILQPTMAALLALRAGLKDARESQPPYLWSVFTDPVSRADLLREGWEAIARVFLLAVTMDVIYQWIVLGWIYPGEALLVAILLAVVPYGLIRGPVNRIARQWRRSETTKKKSV
jgi:hypothetical protein